MSAAGARSPAVHRHPDTWLSLEDTAVRNWDRMVYRKTYDFPGERIDDAHRRLGETPVSEHGFIDTGVTGWLLPADALKLYELAYFAGPVLDLGTCCGLSASVILEAVRQSGRDRTVVTVDLDGEVQDGARWHLDRAGTAGREQLRYFAMDAAAFLDEVRRRGGHTPKALDRLLGRPKPGGVEALPRRFSFVFVDHSHAYEPVAEVCRRLGEVVEPGGFVLFHDYNDPRNIQPEVTDYAVHQAVADALPAAQFEFYGVFGCTGLFRRAAPA